MKYSLSQYKTLAERFNNNSFLGKVMLIKQNPEIFRLEVSDGNFFLRLCDEEMMVLEVDFLFNFPQFLSDKEFFDIFSLIDLKIKIV